MTTKAQMQKATEALRTAITENVDGFYADRIDYVAFGKIQTALWDAAHALGIAADLSATLTKRAA